MFANLTANLLSPIPLAFALGILARLVRSELSLPKDLYTSLSIYLLFAIGLKGGVELSHSAFAEIAAPAGVTLLLGCLTPLSTYAVMRYIGRFSTSNAAGMAAHYGSVSAVTFIAAQQYMERVGAPAEGFMPTLLTLLESPGIHIALAIGAMACAREVGAQGGQTARTWEVLHEVLTGRMMILLVLAFGIVMPMLHGALGAALGTWAGLSVGGAAVLGTMAASASYIAAPPAVRSTLPDANPTNFLTSSLAITIPFNILAGIPIYFRISQLLHG